MTINNHNLKAVILAAGRGSRLEPLTKSKPKALIKVAGVPLLLRTINSLKEVGISDIYVVDGYKGEEIRREIEENRYGLRITYVRNPDYEKGNLHSLLSVKDIKRNFLLLMSDHIYDLRILKNLANSDLRSSVVVAVDKRDPLPEDTKVLEKDSKVLKIGKDVEGNSVDIGAFLCSPKIFTYAENAVGDGKGELADAISYASSNRDAEVFDITKIPTYVPSMRREIKSFWMDVDTLEDVIKAKKLLIENSCKGRNDLLATYFNKPIENQIVNLLADMRVTPNQISILTNLLAYTATFLFLRGSLLAASLMIFVVSFMDGVDGKLSRVKGIKTKIGMMEHAFDFLFEHSWYIALAIYLSGTYGILPILLSTFIVLFDGFSHYCGQAFGKAIKDRPLADYGRIERIFRKFDGRKNSYIIFILIGTLLNMPYYSLIAISTWSFVSATFYCSRTIWHLHQFDKLTSLQPMQELL